MAESPSSWPCSQGQRCPPMGANDSQADGQGGTPSRKKGSGELGTRKALEFLPSYLALLPCTRTHLYTQMHTHASIPHTCTYDTNSQIRTCLLTQHRRTQHHTPCPRVPALLQDVCMCSLTHAQTLLHTATTPSQMIAFQQ